MKGRHDWLIRTDGSVRTLAEILRAFPRADVFTRVDALEPEERAFLGGVLFDEATPESLLEALDRFEAARFSSSACRASALHFSPRAFRDGLRSEEDGALHARGWARSQTEGER